MTKIKFGTDGWRAIIAKEYTVDNVKRIATATALWIKQNGGDSLVLGYDCRFGGLMFAETTAQIMAHHGIKTYFDKNISTTPMVSLGVVKKKTKMGVVITASHNPPTYNGYKLKSELGGPSIPKDIDAVEALIPTENITDELPSLAQMEQDGLLEYVNLEDIYMAEVESKFDLKTIRESGVICAYDAMYGAGQNVVRRILPSAVPLHCEMNPSFNGQAPEPIHKNLTELSNLIKNNDRITCGLANDGDADRIGMYDEDGNFVSSHQILLLIVHYLHKYKNMTGKVVVSFSVTDKVKKLCELYGLEYQVVKIGFKHIAEIMITEDVLVGGEESGGIAAAGHIPERDGAWIGLLILEFMAKTGKSIKELMEEVYALVGHFAFDRDDLHIANDKKWAIIDKCKNNEYTQFGDYTVQRVETIDGYKFYLSEDKWVMIRPSGTEPVLRVYAQGPTAEEVRNILSATHATLG
ncbi:phosphohexomutase domain-containing protein [Aureispira anguillae]|uniref:Phosphoglucomutase/phosphomannomutase family protein n=1 Tax=Aureispira anguillae TaxID=2864201 RepID=A0A916DWQ7_9BACT|nr:phosphoglucomutase/phosphomannomutase family protein [Aureispira anguillae]BDS14950.1 phosphoglucomutase/phosphomannomutase family protein [Aureispira anguillae]